MFCLKKRNIFETRKKYLLFDLITKRLYAEGFWGPASVGFPFFISPSHPNQTTASFATVILPNVAILYMHALQLHAIFSQKSL